jgi:hypothetical protein
MIDGTLISWLTLNQQMWGIIGTVIIASIWFMLSVLKVKNIKTDDGDGLVTWFGYEKKGEKDEN